MLKIYRNHSDEVKNLITRLHSYDEELLTAVKKIVDDVRRRGEKAVFEYTKHFDGAELIRENWQVSEKEMEEAYAQVDGEFLEALRRAKKNISVYHQKQLSNSWWQMDEQGNILGQLYRPLARVGIYVPGGTAAYPSSVLMTALPAVVAGVKEIIMTSPPNADGSMNPYTLVAAKEAGVTAIYKMGGAQAVAALAYGTESLKPVHKIVGPGNIYVTLAKKLVYGQVDIDMLAGPSEILIVADKSAKPEYVAADLLSQAEHDIMASAILLTPEKALAQEVQKQVEIQLEKLLRQEIARQALEQAGGIILTQDLEEAVALANELAPEHLELALEDPFRWLGKIENAGAIFLGHYSPEPLGDYYAGPNHVLPTGGTAKFYSPLNVDMYVKKTSVIAYSEIGLKAVGRDIMKLATVEGLDAHAQAIKVRLKEN